MKKEMLTEDIRVREAEKENRTRKEEAMDQHSRSSNNEFDALKDQLNEIKADLKRNFYIIIS